jgi:hypothetical protein
MRLTGRADHGRSRLSQLCRVAVGTSMLGAGIWLGAATVASPAASASKCDVTSVLVTTHNKTSVPLNLNSASHGITNDWCQYPGNPAGPHTVTRWEVGDNLFETQVNVAYVAPNLDTIALSAAARYGGGVEATCRVIPNGRTPAAYKCSAKAHKESLDRGGIGTTHVATVEWVIEHR